MREGCSSDATTAPQSVRPPGQNPAERKPYGTMSSVGGQRPSARGWPVFSDSSSDVFAEHYLPSLERRIMKKLNKVASLFATAALALFVTGVVGADGGQLGQRHRPALEERHQRTLLARWLRGRPRPPCKAATACRPLLLRAPAPAPAPAPRPLRPRLQTIEGCRSCADHNLYVRLVNVSVFTYC